METSVLDQYLKDANPTPSITDNLEVIDETVVTEESNAEAAEDVEEVIEEEGTSFLDEYLNKPIPSKKTETNEDDSDLDYRTAYLAKVKLGEWQPIDGAEDVEWNEENFKKIAEAQKDSTKSPEQKQLEQSPISDKEWLLKEQNKLKVFEELDCDDIETAKELVSLYEIQERGSTEAIVLKKMKGLDDEDIITEAKTIRSKIVSDTKSGIAQKEESEKVQKQKEQEAWDNYQTSFISAGEKYKITKEASIKKIDMIKSGELNNKFWEIIYNPELAHKIIDFIADPTKYDTKIENKQKNKLIVEQLTKKNISETLPSNKPSTLKIKF